MASTGCVTALLRAGRHRCQSRVACSTVLSSTQRVLPLPLSPTPITPSTWQSSYRPPCLPSRFFSSSAVAPVLASDTQRVQLSPPAAVVECASSSRPHPDKREGEDTYSVHASPEAVTLAVYDGVGSWSFEQGVDVTLFAKRIKQLTDDLLADSSSSSSSSSTASSPLPPAALLDAVWRRLSADRVRGSCTVCIVSLSASPNGCRLDAVTLGDSGFLVLRKRQLGEAEEDVTDAVDESDSTVSVITAYSNTHTGNDVQRETNDSHAHSAASRKQLPYYVHYRSMQQLHYFNCPFQLGFTADGGSASSQSSHSSSADSTSSTDSSPFDLPSAARPTSLTLRADDVVLLSSDGLFDNLDERSIVELVSAAGLGEGRGSGSGSGSAVSELTNTLAAAAFERSLDKRVDGPFAYAAKDHNIMWSGGRKDDITVIVAHVTQPAKQQQQQQQ